MGNRRARREERRELNADALSGLLEHHGVEIEPVFLATYEWAQHHVAAKDAIDFYLRLVGTIYEKPRRV